MSVEDKFTFTLSLEVKNETTGIKIYDIPTMNWYNLSYEDMVDMEATLIDWLKVLNVASQDIIEQSKSKVPGVYK
jgi:hypothetical protein